MNRETVEIRQRLEARLQALYWRLAEIEETLREPENVDIEEQVVEVNDDDVLDRVAVSGRQEAAQIVAALKRIDDGTYGRCLACRRKISSIRLRVLPEAAVCRRCAQRQTSSVA